MRPPDLLSARAIARSRRAPPTSPEDAAGVVHLGCEDALAVIGNRELDLPVACLEDGNDALRTSATSAGSRAETNQASGRRTRRRSSAAGSSRSTFVHHERRRPIALIPRGRRASLELASHEGSAASTTEEMRRPSALSRDFEAATRSCGSF